MKFAGVPDTRVRGARRGSTPPIHLATTPGGAGPDVRDARNASRRERAAAEQARLARAFHADDDVVPCALDDDVEDAEELTADTTRQQRRAPVDWKTAQRTECNS